MEVSRQQCFKLKSNSRYGNVDLLWKKYFKDPSLWHETRGRKNSCQLPDFRNRTTSESLWIHEYDNPVWVHEELRRRTDFLSKNGWVKDEASDKKREDFSVVTVLKDCAKKRDLSRGSRLHADILKVGVLRENLYLASTLINMYAKCGALAQARQVLEELPDRDIVCWNALIAGYAQQEQSHEALNCFEQMQQEGLAPDVATFTCILKACGSIGAVEKGKQIHEDIVGRDLLEKDVVLGTALVDMYAKCGLLPKARQVLEELPVRNVVSWNALITGYTEQDQAYEALQCFQLMQIDNISPNAVTFICVLKSCGSAGSINEGNKIHDEVLRRNLLEKDIALGNALVDMYVKCGRLGKAAQVLEELPFRDAVSWNALVAGYVQQREDHRALNCFESMCNEGLSPTAVTFTCILKASGRIRDIDRGKKIHDKVRTIDLLKEDIMLGTALVDMYVKCGVLMDAQRALEELPVRNVVTWSALIAGYAQEGKGQEAIVCFEQMQREDILPNAFTFIVILKACGSIQAIDDAKKIHNMIIRKGLLEKDIILGCVLVDTYAKCGHLSKARQVFEELPLVNITSSSTSVEQHFELLEYFEWTQNERLSEESIVFICILNACGTIQAIDKGKQVHDAIVYMNLLEKDVMIGTALVEMYVKCGDLTKAQHVLDHLPAQNAISWSLIISGYIQQGQHQNALNCFEQMQNEGVPSDSIIFTSILKACGSVRAVGKGKEIHEEILNRDLLCNDIVLSTALLDMYVKCGFPEIAYKILKDFCLRNVPSWNALIAGLVRQKQFNKALNCFEAMKNEGLIPSEITFFWILKACGYAGALDKGKEVHSGIVQRCLLENGIALGNALVGMYAKSGVFSKARQVLEGLSVRDVFSWNALIAGYSQWGQNVDAVKCFKQMQNDGIYPDEVTFLCVLSACSHAGSANQAQTVFENMTKQYGISPNLEHHTCMVVIFCYEGHFERAMSIINSIPCSSYEIWLALLGGCRKWGNVMLARLAFDQILQLNDCCPAAYVVITKLFAAVGMQKDAESIEALRLKRCMGSQKYF